MLFKTSAVGGRERPTRWSMISARLRMARYYLAYARQHKDNWQALDGAEFAQIRRGWAVASEGCVGLTADEQANLIFGYLNALDGYLERRGLWAELLAWNQRALAAAESIGNEALVGGLLNDIGLCHRHLGQYEEAGRSSSRRWPCAAGSGRLQARR